MDIQSPAGEKVTPSFKQNLQNGIVFHYEGPVLRSSAKRKENSRHSGTDVVTTQNENSRMTRAKSRKVDESPTTPSAKRKPKPNQQVTDTVIRQCQNETKQSTILKFLEIDSNPQQSIVSSKLVHKRTLSPKQKDSVFHLKSSPGSTRVLRSMQKGKTKAPESPVENKSVTRGKSKNLEPQLEDKSVERRKRKALETPIEAKRVNRKKNEALEAPVEGKRVNKGKSQAPESPVEDKKANKGKNKAPKSPVEYKKVNKGKNKAPKSPISNRRVTRGTSKASETRLDDKNVKKGKNNAQDKRVSGGKNKALKSPAEYKDVNRSTMEVYNKDVIGSSVTQVSSVAKTRKRRRKAKKASHDEYFEIRKRVRYVLKRMNYEQSLIEAYAGEGWRGQSLEKIRLVKELERAKSEMLRCKLKIRDSFHHLDSLLSIGKFMESLFDSEGEICSEDIYCSKCGSKDLSVDNDIVLCDGICDRGFHQKCLDPPLLTENIPAGDEGWLCPACDCKVDCLELLNEFLGSDMKIETPWEKVFPEAAAIADAGKQYADHGCASDDSEDDDYNPDAVEADVEGSAKRSGSEESDSASLSDDKRVSSHHAGYSEMGLPSEDSEDDDYNPDKVGVNQRFEKNGSNSEESDFTSDSDEFCSELAKQSAAEQAPQSSLSNRKPLRKSGKGTSDSELNPSLNLEPCFFDGVPHDEDLGSPISARRQLERLDYKKLYDEQYGQLSSDSCDDDDWSEMSKSRKGKKHVAGQWSDVLRKTDVTHEASGRTTLNSNGGARRMGYAIDYSQVGHGSRESPLEAQQKSNLEIQNNSLCDSKDVSLEIDKNRKTSVTAARDHSLSQDAKNPPSRTRQRLNFNAANNLAHKEHTPSLFANGKDSSVHKKNRGVTSQKLVDAFEENQYPMRAEKESLAEELHLTFRQVDKWFDNARHSRRSTAKESKQEEEIASRQEDTSNTPTDLIVMVSDPGASVDRTPSERMMGRNSAIVDADVAEPSPIAMYPDDAPGDHETAEVGEVYMGIACIPSSAAAVEEKCTPYKQIAPHNDVPAAVNDPKVNATTADGSPANVAGNKRKSCPVGGSQVRDDGVANGRLNLSMDKDRRKAVARELRLRRKIL